MNRLFARWLLPALLSWQAVFAIPTAIAAEPAMAKLCQAKLPAGYTSDGEDMSTAILGEALRRTKPLYWEYGRNNTSFAYPKEATQRSPNLAVREGDWKLLVNADGSAQELYNLSADSRETNNLSAAKPDVAKRLAEQALAWRKSLP